MDLIDVLLSKMLSFYTNYFGSQTDINYFPPKVTVKRFNISEDFN